MEFKEKLQELRKTKGLSQEKVAEKLNISRQAVAKWESGESYPDIDNLIQLSNLYNISIDRLLKDDNCIEAININSEMDLNDIITFLITAKKNTYAGNSCENEVQMRPGSHDLVFTDGKYQYIDTYLGGERFIGEEAVFENGKAVWAMNYNGIEYNEKFSTAFLKLALSTVNEEMPYRGQQLVQDGDYTYVCEVKGDFKYFSGRETMYFHNEKVYECSFSGGIVK